LREMQHPMHRKLTAAMFEHPDEGIGAR
jgi:hypothetical protein